MSNLWISVCKSSFLEDNLPVCFPQSIERVSSLHSPLMHRTNRPKRLLQPSIQRWAKTEKHEVPNPYLQQFNATWPNPAARNSPTNRKFFYKRRKILSHLAVSCFARTKHKNIKIRILRNFQTNKWTSNKTAFIL